MTDPSPPDNVALADDAESESVLSAAEQRITARLIEIEAILGSGNPEAIRAVQDEVDLLKTQLESEPLRSAASAATLRAAVLTAGGHLVRVLGQNEEAVSRYDEAIRLLNASPEGAGRHRQAANLWTCRGLALLAMNEVEASEKALGSFDEAITIRSAAELPRSAADQWGLAAAWLNRADALAFLGGSSRLADALDATRQAREELAALDAPDDPSYRVRFALAWMKESEISARRWIEFRSGVLSEVLGGFHRAAAILRSGAEAGEGESRRVLATVLVNLSRTRLYLGETGSSEGEGEALEALRWVGDATDRFVEAAMLAATARLTTSLHIANSAQEKERAIEITDHVEEGLATVAKWRKSGRAQAFDEGLVAELMRLGAEGYLTAAPQFLSDFLLDQLDPERTGDHFADLGDCHEVAVKALWKGISMIQKKGFSDIGGDEYESRRTLLVAWEQCRERLAEIRPVYFEI